MTIVSEVAKADLTLYCSQINRQSQNHKKNSLSAIEILNTLDFFIILWLFICFFPYATLVFIFHTSLVITSCLSFFFTDICWDHTLFFFFFSNFIFACSLRHIFVYANVRCWHYSWLSFLYLILNCLWNFNIFFSFIFLGGRGASIC